ncbi:hypothetical protein IEQ34_013002 [Dendrobium chrysotoxum]|uniref:Bulb-type lectin domain-containing protein n=1 Tax=Dendrobium chrysotoxum TaxID=161865 RepID=A0AAV7GNT1_DENCH|nr:hypothetical protein IEQ34_013002 [Dendrobium chrysotoxum]
MAAFSSSSSATILLLLTLGLMTSYLSTRASADNRLNTGESLHAFQSLSYGQYFLSFRKFCLLFFENGNTVIWKAEGEGVFCTLRMQSDGNLVMRGGTDPNGEVVWASNTNQPNPTNDYYLLVTNQVAIYDGQNNAIWVNGNKVVR